jgi:hypothetical protein
VLSPVGAAEARLACRSLSLAPAAAAAAGAGAAACVSKGELHVS